MSSLHARSPPTPRHFVWRGTYRLSGDHHRGSTAYVLCIAIGLWSPDQPHKDIPYTRHPSTECAYAVAQVSMLYVIGGTTHVGELDHLFQPEEPKTTLPKDRSTSAAGRFSWPVSPV